MSLTGSPFSPWVRKQVNARQKVLGKYKNISSEDLQSYTNKTPFLRLASSVNLTNEGPEKDGKKTVLKNSVLKKLAKSLGVPEGDLSSSKLAKSFILQGGAIAEDHKLQKGLNNGKDLFNGAYGWGGTEERGYVPMPGITDASVTYYSNGALSKASINVRLYSKAQFSMFDVLYLRPGYTLLLEFGHSMYLDTKNDGSLQSMDEFMSEPLSNFLNTDGNITQYEIYRFIKKEREKYSGNYEAVFGKISKFGWKFNPDGSYECSIELTGMGDIVESLKANIASPYKDNEAVNQALIEVASSAAEVAGTTVPPLITNANKTIINTELFKIYQNSKASGFRDYTVANMKIVDESGKTAPKSLVIPQSIFSIKDLVTTDDGDGALASQTYIKYGAFLAFLQSEVFLYNAKQNSSPLIVFDVNFEDLDKDENVILKIPGGLSANPLVCLIPYQNSIVPDEGLPIPDSPINTAISGTAWPYNQYLGKVTQIFLNTHFIASCLGNTTESGDINMLDFLKKINQGIITSLGGINGFEIKLDDEFPNKLIFYENIPQRIPKWDAVQEEYTRFNVYGVKPGVDGSFVRSINLTSELSNNLAAMISIGSQANANQVSSNAVAFSSYSAGLVDRITEDKLSSTSTEITKKETEANTPLSIKSNWDTNINPPENSLFQSIYGDFQWTSENIQSFVSHVTTHCNLILGELTKKQPEGAQLQSPMFLPFNLSLEIDGLSGMRLYQKFLMTDDILPPSYEKDGVDLQIKSINHNITSQAWTTKLETISTPADKLGPIKRPKSLSSAVTRQSGTSPGPGRSTAPPPGQQPPEDEKLRVRVTRIMDDGTQTLGYMEVLAEDEKTVLYTLATSELPWRGNKNSVSSIPVDKYRVKSHVSGKHGQCFWVIGNAQGNYAFNKLFGNGYIRGAVLIHKSPKAPGWLEGCIGPGLRFNVSATPPQTGKQKGTGKKYLSNALAESYKAMDKIVATLYSVGSYRMEIVNYGGAANGNLPSSFNDTVKSIARSKNLIQ